MSGIGHRRRCRCGRRGQRQREMLSRDEPSLAENRRPLERVSQLAHVAWPVIVQQKLTCLPGNAGRWTTETAANVVQERLAEWQDVLRAVAETGQQDLEDVQP